MSRWWRRVILVAAKVKWLVVVIQKDRKCLKHDFCFGTPQLGFIKMSSVLESIRTRSGVTDDLKVSLDLENQELISTNFRQYHQEHPMFSNGTCGKCNL